jgi:anti-anti-sigma factor
MTIVAAAPTAGARLWVQWTLSNRGRSTVVSFAGEIDAANADHLVDTLGAVLGTCSERLIVDLTAVGFVDAVGACALLRARQQAGARAIRLDVVCADRVPRRVLTVPGDDEEIEFFGSVAEALGARRSCELSGGAPTDR